VSDADKFKLLQN